MSDELVKAANLAVQEYGAAQNDQERGRYALPHAMQVVRAYLAEHPADDDEPITEDWLRSVGAVKEDNPAKWTFYRDDALPVGLWKVDDGWKAMLILAEHAAACLVRGLTNRGELRRLLAAIGINLKGEA